MAVMNGKSGTLEIGAGEVTPVKNWTLSITSSNRDYAANNTSGWKKRSPGVKDSSGNFEVLAESTGNCPVEEGDSVTLKLHIDAIANSNYYEVPAVIDRVDVLCDMNDGNIIAYMIDFSGDGAITKNGVVATS